MNTSIAYTLYRFCKHCKMFKWSGNQVNHLEIILKILHRRRVWWGIFACFENKHLRPWHSLTTYKLATVFFTVPGPVGWGYRIHRQLLCRGVRLSQRVSCIRHSTIWWRGSSNSGALGNVEYSFITIAPTSTLTRSGSILSIGPVEVNSVLMLNWIVWNKTIFDIKTVYLC